MGIGQIKESPQNTIYEPAQTRNPDTDTLVKGVEFEIKNIPPAAPTWEEPSGSIVITLLLIVVKQLVGLVIEGVPEFVFTVKVSVQAVFIIPPAVMYITILEIGVLKFKLYVNGLEYPSPKMLGGLITEPLQLEYCTGILREVPVKEEVIRIPFTVIGGRIGVLQL